MLVFHGRSLLMRWGLLLGLWVLWSMGSLAIGQRVQLPATIQIDEEQVIRRFDPSLLGIGQDMIMNNLLVVMEPGDRLAFRQDYLRMMDSYPLASVRIVMHPMKWQQAIGVLADRPAQKLAPWAPTVQQKFGPVELIQSTRQIDPQAGFVWCLNLLNETEKDHADLAAFLCGDIDSPDANIRYWARQRVLCGLPNPVRIDAWELGNEMDWQYELDPTQAWNVQQYVRQCEKTIAAIRAVDPHARFAAHSGSTSSFHPRWQQVPGGWAGWHRPVLESLGKDIVYIAHHEYYTHRWGPLFKLDADLDTISQDIRRITGSDRIRILITEHAFWPDEPVPGQDIKEWKRVWYQTHALMGCLATADRLADWFQRTDLAGIYYHNLSSGPWGLIKREEDETGTLWSTGMYDLYRLFWNARGRKVVRTFLQGEQADPRGQDVTLRCVAMTTDQGLHLIFVNRHEQAERSVQVRGRHSYTLEKKVILTADTLHSANSINQKNIRVFEEPGDSASVFNVAMIPSKSVTVFYLQRR